MKNLLTVSAMLSLVLIAAAASAQPYYATGDFEGWSASTYEMTDDGLNGDVVAGDGIYSCTVNIATAGRHEWKAALSGWADSWPHSGNSWFYTVNDNEDVLFTFNTNTVGDGWLADGMWPYTDHSMALTLVGDMQTQLGDAATWDNAGSLIMHDDGMNGDAVAGDGYYTFTGNVTAGTYYWKVVLNGTWDAIGSDGAGVNASNMQLDVAADGPAFFVFDSNLGRLYGGTMAPVANESTSWSAVKSIYR